MVVGRLALQVHLAGLLLFTNGFKLYNDCHGHGKVGSIQKLTGKRLVDSSRCTRLKWIFFPFQESGNLSSDEGSLCFYAKSGKKDYCCGVDLGGGLQCPSSLLHKRGMSIKKNLLSTLYISSNVINMIFLNILNLRTYWK